MSIKNDIRLLIKAPKLYRLRRVSLSIANIAILDLIMYQNISHEVILLPDIVDIIWKYIDFEDYFKASLISKMYYEIIKNITNNKIYYIFNEMSIYKYLLYYAMAISNKYRYNFKNKKIMNFKNKIVLYYLENNENNQKILLTFIELALHSLNKNYKELYNTIKSIDISINSITYNVYIYTLHFIISQQEGIEYKSLFLMPNNYNSETIKLYKVSIALLLFNLNNFAYKNINSDINKIGLIISKIQKEKCIAFLDYFNEKNNAKYPKYIKKLICEQLNFNYLLALI
jgi:hypothetical protein